MDCVEAEGNTIDDAIASALQQLATTRDRVEVEILSDAARGFLGFGARKARVRVTRRMPLGAGGPTPTAQRVEDPMNKAPAARGAPPAEAATSAAPAGVPGTAPAPLRRPTDRVGEAAAEGAAALMREIIQHLGVRAAVTLERMEDGQFLINLSGDASGILIGRRGQMLDALEYLANRVAGRDSGEAARIVVDVENYRARRREALELMARRSAEKAKEKQRSVVLNPMSPRDRRIVHLALQDDPTLVTRSAGEGYLRKLIIVPANADRRRRGPGRGPQP